MKVTPESLAAALESEAPPPTEPPVHPPGPVANELRTLVQVAQRVPRPAPVHLDDAAIAHGRQALLSALAMERRGPIARRWRLLAFGPCSWIGPGQRGAIAAAWAAALLVALLAVGAGAASAAQEALPGEPLYAFKTALESVQTGLVTGEAARAGFHLELAARRLAEAERAMRAGQAEAAAIAATAYAGEIRLAESHLAAAGAVGEPTGDLDDRLTALKRRSAPPLPLAGAAPARATGRGVAPDPKGSAGPGKAPDIDDRAPAGGAPAGDLDADDTPAPAGGSVLTSTGLVSLTGLISDVQGLAADDLIPGQSYEGLLAKLHAAQAALERGQPHVALQVTEAFLHQLNALHRSGHIGEANYEALVAQYNALVTALGGEAAAPDKKPEPEPAGAPRAKGERPQDPPPLTVTPTPAQGKAAAPGQTTKPPAGGPPPQAGGANGNTGHGNGGPGGRPDELPRGPSNGPPPGQGGGKSK